MVEKKPVALDYDLHDPCAFRADLLVNELVVVEPKAKAAIHAIDKAEALSRLRLMKLSVGLLSSFHEARLVDGFHRIVNKYQGPKVTE
ncbi:hypothetical protein Poly59_45730 [Rubripirellula reticaptiva]|uniref:GxxExxY protein n=1 Tax=Rubripirellula reticaptiva TaxID=2528013 RepID=A0A5C6EFF7_9BACT|nr:hypothetical protein Poly59_45730 [Rubripirellula reticaptiva]